MTCITVYIPPHVRGFRRIEVIVKTLRAASSAKAFEFRSAELF